MKGGRPRKYHTVDAKRYAHAKAQRRYAGRQVVRDEYKNTPLPSGSFTWKL